MEDTGDSTRAKVRRKRHHRLKGKKRIGTNGGSIEEYKLESSRMDWDHPKETRAALTLPKT